MGRLPRMKNGFVAFDILLRFLTNFQNQRLTDFHVRMRPKISHKLIQMSSNVILKPIKTTVSTHAVIYLTKNRANLRLFSVILISFQI